MFRLGDRDEIGLEGGVVNEAEVVTGEVGAVEHDLAQVLKVSERVGRELAHAAVDDRQALDRDEPTGNTSRQSGYYLIKKLYVGSTYLVAETKYRKN